jgi:hypothetical protein
LIDIAKEGIVTYAAFTSSKGEIMFGLGFWEFAILAIVLVAIFGIGPVKAMAAKAMQAKEELNEAKKTLRDPLGLKDMVNGEKKSDDKKE